MNINDEVYKPKYKNACIFIKALPLSIMFQSIASGWTSIYEFVIVWLVASWVAAGVLTAIDNAKAEEFYKEQAKKQYKKFINMQ